MLLNNMYPIDVPTLGININLAVEKLISSELKRNSQIVIVVVLIITREYFPILYLFLKKQLYKIHPCVVTFNFLITFK